MKNTKTTLLAAALALVVAIVALAAITPGVHGADAKAMGKIRHIVLLHLKEAVSAEQQKELQKAADKLRADVETVQTLELGKNLDSNTRNDGYTECLFVTFRDEAGLKTYATHPGHEAFKKVLGPMVDKVLVFDYAAE